MNPLSVATRGYLDLGSPQGGHTYLSGGLEVDVVITEQDLVVSFTEQDLDVTYEILEMNVSTPEEQLDIGVTETDIDYDSCN